MSSRPNNMQKPFCRSRTSQSFLLKLKYFDIFLFYMRHLKHLRIDNFQFLISSHALLVKFY